MRNILIILLFITSGANGQSGVLGRINYSQHPLIIIAGESNAGGTASNDSLTIAEAADRPFLKILNNENFLFETLRIGGNNLLLHQGLPGGVTHGIENGLANSTDSGTLGTNATVYIMKAGIGASQINWWNDSTYLYTGVNAWIQFNTRLDTAIKLLRPLNSNAPPQLYFFWTLGINDALNSIPVATWKANTKTFFIKLRQRYGNMPIFMTYLTPTYTTYNTAITELSSEVDNFYAIQTNDAALVDVNHWGYSGWKIIASRFIYTLLAHYRYRLGTRPEGIILQ
jgi:hypothetical protein